MRRLSQHLLTICVVVMLVSVAVLSYRNLAEFISHERRVQQASSALMQIETTSSDVARIEASSRAYVLTSKQEYRERFQRRHAAANADIDNLEKSMGDSAEAQLTARKLRTATSELIAVLDLAMSMRDQMGPEQATQAILRSQRNSDRVRGLLAEMQQSAESALNTTAEQSTRAAVLARDGVIVAALINIIVFVLWAYLKASEVIRSQRRQSQMSLSTIADCSDDAILGCDVGGFISSSNPAAERIFGYTAHEMAGLSMSVLSGDDSMPAMFRKVCTGEKVDRAETTAVTKNGDEIHILLSVSPVRNANGAIGWVLLIARDVTVQKRAERVLRETGEQYRLIFEGNPLPMWVMDRKTLRFLTVNDAAVGNYGYARDEFLSMTILDIRPPAEIPAVLETIAEPLTGLSEISRWTHLKKDGTPMVVEITRHRIPFNGCDAELVLANDITERNKNEEALRSSEERFSKAFRLSPVGITISTLSEGRYVDANEAFLDLIGYTQEEVIGHTVHELGIWKDEDRAKLVNLLGNRTRATLNDVVFKTASGQAKIVQVSADLINLDGEVCVVSITFDVTERKNLEHQLRQAQKMEAVGRLAGGVAHDFNNMLGVISGYADLVRGHLENDPACKAQIEQIRKASDRAASLTRQLLAFSRKQVMQPKTLDLNERIRDLTQMLQRLIGDDIELVVRAGGQVSSVKADPGQIDQVIMNLAVNARDAMPCGGKFIIETACAELDVSNIPRQHRAKPGKYVLLKISDTGHGMDAETLSHIFEPFFTTKEPGKGTGLGLSTVHGIISQSDGYIWVYSEPERGTTFKIYLPAVTASVASLDASRPQSVTKGSGTILLAEDDAPMRELTLHLLESGGYRVIAACDGDQALQLAQGYKNEIDLLITDVVMPRLSGPGLVERLRACQPKIKIVYMSGYTDELLAHHGALDNAVTFLEKPFTQDSLMHAVQAALRSPDATSAQLASATHA